MPYVWTPAPLFLEHKGVKVYRVYYDDKEVSGISPFQFGLTPDCSEIGNTNGEFDARELSTWGTAITNAEGLEDYMRGVIIAAIDKGELKRLNSDDWPKTEHLYVYGPRETAYDVGEKLGLTGEALRLFSFAAEEHKITYRVTDDGKATPIALDDRPLFNGSTIREEEPGYLLGTMRIFGVDHHVEFLRVVEDEDGSQEAWESPVDPQNNNFERLHNLNQYDDCKHQTVNVPGFEGDYVCVVTPYGE